MNRWKASMSRISPISPTWLVLAGSVKSRTVMPKGLKTSSRFGERSQCSTSSTSWKARIVATVSPVRLVPPAGGDVDQQLVSRNGAAPKAYERMKESWNLGIGETVVLKLKFTDNLGTFVFHCHILEHEDAAMMALFATTTALVFSSAEGQPLRRNFYRRHFKPAVRNADLPEALRFHDLRHTCAAMLIAQGAHPKEIQERLGHSTIRLTFDRYGHLFPGLDARLRDGLEAGFRAVRRLVELGFVVLAND